MKFTVKEDDTLLSFLVKATSASSKSKMRLLLQSGSVSVEGAVQKKADTPLTVGQRIEINRGDTPLKKKQTHADKKEYDRRPKARFPVLYEDRHLIAVEKPAGLLSIGTDREKTKTFYKMVSEYVKSASEGEEKIFIVHRLDREVSGVMIFAKNEAIKEALQGHWTETEKVYLALVEGNPKEEQGTVTNWLKENSAFHVYVCSQNTPGAQQATTHYRVLKSFPRNALLDVQIDTGRKHQIRIHLAGLGCPIVGDKKYGATTKPIRRLGLHAFSLTFTHPVTRERIRLESPAPEVFLQYGKRNALE